ncbi:AAEL010212-PA [Aedes aegypti]|uniref:AAEL010212-PA n=1 Tax=Aedes aegypti TaxID=7159 RepID=Q16TK5_AEDAE|nr:AAEL010212-PA [Aedes aegypti]
MINNFRLFYKTARLLALVRSYLGAPGRAPPYYRHEKHSRSMHFLWFQQLCMDRGNTNQAIPGVQRESALVVQVGRLQGGCPANRRVHRLAGKLPASVRLGVRQPFRSGRRVQQTARRWHRKRRGNDLQQHVHPGSAGIGLNETRNGQQIRRQKESSFH